MPNENLISTLEQSLRQTRAARTRLAARLAELEAEAETVRAEITEMDNLTGQTEAAIMRLLSSVLTANTQVAVPLSDAEIEAAIRQDTARSSYTARSAAMHTPTPMHTPAHVPAAHHYVPPVQTSVEVTSDRFQDRTIPQATTMILREAGGPLHVNEIYTRLLEGGFVFTGHNPTISIAVSLNRNGRFRKVAPGTFDLVMREATQAI